MGSLADLYVDVYFDAAMQQYAVLRPGGDGSSTYVWSILATNEPSIQGCFRYPFEW